MSDGAVLAFEVLGGTGAEVGSGGLVRDGGFELGEGGWKASNWPVRARTPDRQRRLRQAGERPERTSS